MRHYFFIGFLLILMGAGCVTSQIESEGQKEAPRAEGSIGIQDTIQDNQIVQNANEPLEDFVDRSAVEKLGIETGRIHRVVFGNFGELADYGAIGLYAVGSDSASQGYAGVVLLRDEYSSRLWRVSELQVPTVENVTHVEGVLLPRINGAKGPAIAVLTSQMTGIGPTGAQPWFEAHVYLWDENAQQFVLNPELTLALVEAESMAQLQSFFSELTQ